MTHRFASGGSAFQVLIVFSMALFFSAGFRARCGEDHKPEPLPQVVVTAPQPESPPSVPAKVPADNSNSPTRQTAGGADIVSVQKFIEGRTGTAVDFFEGTPGLFIQSENGAQFLRISIRGSGIESEASGIQYLIDGVPINQADGRAMIEDVDLLAVKSAEVYRGSNALRYGALGLGGAINFQPRTGYDSAGFGVRLEAGSFGYYSESASFGGVTGSTDYYGDLQDLQSDGYRKHSAEDSQKFFGDAGFKLGCNAENRVYLSLGRLNREDPGGLTIAQLHSNPRLADDGAIAMDFLQNWENLRLADKATFKFDDAQTFSASAFYQYRILTNKQLYDVDLPVGIARYHSHDLGMYFNYDNVADLACHQNRLTLGFTPTLEFKSDASYQNLNSVQGPAIDGDRTIASNYILFGEDQFHFSDNLSAIGGIQLIRSHRDFLDALRPAEISNRTRAQDFFGVDPKVGLLYDICGKDQVFGNFSRSFQPPSFDDLVSVQSGAGLLYRPLRPQTGSTVEVGGRGEHDRFDWEFSMYHTWLRNELLSLENAKGVSAGAVNAGSTYHQGIEAEIDGGPVARHRGRRLRRLREQTGPHRPAAKLHAERFSLLKRSRVRRQPPRRHPRAFLHGAPGSTAIPLDFMPAPEWNAISRATPWTTPIRFTPTPIRC